MHAFHRKQGQVACQFETSEIELLESLLGQLIELLLDEAAPATGPGTDPVPELPGADDDIFARLEREMTQIAGADYFADAPRLDPVLQRLFPDAYPDDPVASHDFQRFTQAALRDDKVGSAQVMLTDLRQASDTGYCRVPAAHTTAWLKSLTNMRLALAVRMGIGVSVDADELADLPEDDPRGWIYSIYEWAGWVQESLLATQD